MSFTSSLGIFSLFWNNEATQPIPLATLAKIMNISGLSYQASPYSTSPAARPAASSAPDGVSSRQDGSQKTAGQSSQLSADDQAQLNKLKARDREVRQHEAAHLAAAGGLATSGSSFTYQKGPDGVNYAIGGEVSINTSPGDTPQETLRRAQIIRAAALAPADPSGQDRAVAAQASQMAQEANAEISQQQQSSTPNNGDGSGRSSEISRYYATPENPEGGFLDTYA